MSVPQKSFSPLPTPADKGEVWKYEFHPLANIFPMMPDAEIDELASDINLHGLQAPIVIYQNKILDGRNRFRACKKAGIIPAFIAYQGRDPLSAMFSLNVARRHMNPSQRAIFAARIADMKQGDNRGAHRAKEGSANLPTLPADKVSQAEAAKKLSVSERLIRDAKIILKEAPSEKIRDIEAGRRTINSVMKEIKPRIKGADAALPAKPKTTKTALLSPKDEDEVNIAFLRIRECIKVLIKKFSSVGLQKIHAKRILDLATQLKGIAEPESKKKEDAETA